jgi:hypothetical protein
MGAVCGRRVFRWRTRAGDVFAGDGREEQLTDYSHFQEEPGSCPRRCLLTTRRVIGTYSGRVLRILCA